jgi:hypothetical protein
MANYEQLGILSDGAITGHRPGGEATISVQSSSAVANSTITIASKGANTLPPMSDEEKALYKRNGWRKHVRDEVMNTAPTNAGGKAICEGCSAEIDGTITQNTSNGRRQVSAADIDHNPPLEVRVQTWREDVHILGEQPKERSAILDDLNDTSKLRPLCQTCNRNHSIENTDGPYKNVVNGVDVETGETLEEIRLRNNSVE